MKHLRKSVALAMFAAAGVSTSTPASATQIASAGVACSLAAVEGLPTDELGGVLRCGPWVDDLNGVWQICGYVLVDGEWADAYSCNHGSPPTPFVIQRELAAFVTPVHFNAAPGAEIRVCTDVFTSQGFVQVDYDSQTDGTQCGIAARRDDGSVTLTAPCVCFVAAPQDPIPWLGCMACTSGLDPVVVPLLDAVLNTGL